MLVAVLFAAFGLLLTMAVVVMVVVVVLILIAVTGGVAARCAEVKENITTVCINTIPTPSQRLSMLENKVSVGLHFGVMRVAVGEG